MAFRSSLNDCSGKYDCTRKDIVHQHMLAHYRRLYSVKCGIDTSTPAHFKPRYKPKARPALPIADVPKTPQLNSKDLKFLKSLAGEVRTWWNQSSSRPSVHHCGEKNNVDRVKHTSKIPSATDNNHKRDSTFKKGALAYGASSKLREMNVYHPPRRRVMPTALNKHCGHYPSKSNKKVYHEKVGEDISATSKLFANDISTVIGEQREELLYLRFIQDITQDILSSEVYSNEKVLIMFKKHLTLNREKLDMGKMLKEIETLGTRIGLPPYNYSSLFSPRKPVIDDEERELNNCEDSSSEGKRSYSLIFSSKSNLQDFTPSVSSSQSENEIELLKREEVFERQEENNVLGFLEEIGFDPNIAQEISVLMTDKEFTELQFMSNNAKIPTNNHELVSTKETENSKSKKEKHQSKSFTEFLQYNDTNFILGNNKKQQTSNFVQDKALEMERILESIHESDIEENIIENVEPISTTVSIKNTESEISVRSVTEIIKKCGQNEGSKNNSSEQNSKVNPDICSDVIASPMGSDYSSMKDHDDSIYDGYSEDERDGEESASEIAEEIPEDLSQSSISSGISQITEKMKGFSVDMNTLLHSQSNGTKNVSSENNTHMLRKLVL